MPKRRDTKIGEYLYDFLRDNEEYISLYLLEKLEEVFDDVEDFETEYTDEISTVKGVVDELNDKIETLENEHAIEVQELQSQIDALETENYELVNRVGD